MPFSKSVSRVLSRMVIYLFYILLYSSSHQIKKMTSSLNLLVSVLLQMGFTRLGVSLSLRWALTSPFHPYHYNNGGYFLLHFPSGFPHLTLSSILALWGPDFPRMLAFARAIRNHSICYFILLWLLLIVKFKHCFYLLLFFCY